MLKWFRTEVKSVNNPRIKQSKATKQLKAVEAAIGDMSWRGSQPPKMTQMGRLKNKDSRSHDTPLGCRSKHKR